MSSTVGREFLLHAPCWYVCRLRLVGSFFYTPCAVICLVVRREGSLYYTARDGIFLVLGWRGVSFPHPVLKSRWWYVMWGVSLIRPVLDSVSSFGRWGLSFKQPVMESVLSYIGWRVCLTPPVLASDTSFVGRRVLSYMPRAAVSLVFSAGPEFLSHTSCWHLSCRSLGEGGCF